MKKIYTYTTGYILILLLTKPLLAPAQESLSDNQSSQIIVVTANRNSSLINDLLNNTERLNKDEIDFIESSHINESLSRISGVWISRGNGQEHLTAIRSPVFTGPGSCGEFLMLEDDISLRSTGFCNVNQLFDANTEQASSIEVVKGSNSTLYGTNAIHGTVNVIHALPQENNFKIGLLAGPHGYSRLKTSYSQVDSDSSNHNNGLTLHFNTTHDNGFKDDSGFDQQKFHLTYINQYKGLNMTSRLSGSLLNQDTAGFLQQGKDAYRQERFQRTNEFPEAFRNAWSLRLQSKIEGKGNLNNTYLNRWHITPYVRSNKMEFLMHFLPGQPIEKNGHNSIGIQFGAEYLGKNWTLHWGIDNELTDASLTQTQKNPTSTDSNFLNATLPQGAHYDYQVDAINLGTFAQWKYQLSNHWSTSISGRLDYLKYNYDNHLSDGRLKEDGTACDFGGCRYTRPSDRSDHFDNFSWSIATGYQITQNQLTYLKIDHAFRTPQATELYRLQNGQTSTNLNETEANAIELGFRSHYNNGSIEFNLFQINKSDVIFQNSDREIVSGAKTLHRGLEALWNQQLNDIELGITASYAEHIYTNSVDLGGINNADIKGNQIDTAPKLIANVRLAWNYKTSSKAELSWGLVDKYYTNPENTQLYSGHNLLDLRIQEQFSEYWQLSVRISNLTDKRYAERADFAFGNDRYFVGEPRSYYLGISKDWN